jgi:superfamily II DNA or RNA helicase
VDEVKHLVEYEPRNRFIVNLVNSINGNTLVLFRFISHGKHLFDEISKKIDKDRKIFYIFGGTDIEDRENARIIMETEKNAIIIASSKIFSTGINIKQLHNIVFVSPSKARIQTLQSIGRGLRLAENKTHATLFDIADDLRYNTKTPNTTLNHFVERVGFYNEEKLEYKQYKIELKERPVGNSLYR